MSATIAIADIAIRSPYAPPGFAVSRAGNVWVVRGSGEGAVVVPVGDRLHCPCEAGARGKACPHALAVVVELLRSVAVHGFSFWLEGDAYVDGEGEWVLARRGRVGGRALNWFLAVSGRPFSATINAVVNGESMVVRGESRPMNCLQVSLFALDSHPCIKYLIRDRFIDHVQGS
ncbi:hypothetical protein GCM10007981_03340 [Thermocladium modestius]|uniref:SWIM-type domain-containing protein n=1 Tax=Thermocladium modestius TaxID=62609 RepID=A0A830GTI0_9CREN|nr:hypothetical protein [Thermocladium modestius]GGP19481.1 hypothetical protein GCM10007981_03340 [Thermocladium modestius]